MNFKPMESIMLKVDANGIEQINLGFEPKRMREQYFSYLCGNKMNSSMKHIAFILLAFLALASCTNNTLNVNITNANVEQQVRPMPLATATPRFSWNYEATNANDVVQQDYRIIVASTAENAKNNVGDLWDSGVTESS